MKCKLEENLIILIKSYIASIVDEATIEALAEAILGLLEENDE